MTRTKLGPWSVLGAVLLVLSTAWPAAAHRVNVFAYVEGNDVVVECSYSRSQRVRQGAVDVLDAATGAPYLTGVTDEQGAFRFPVPPAARAAKADLRIVLRAGEGHQNDTVVTAGEYLAAAPAVAAPTATTPTAAASAATASAGVAPAASGADPAPSSQTPAAPAVAPVPGSTLTSAQAAMAVPGPTVTPASQPDASPPAGTPPLQAGTSGPVLDQAALQALVEAAVEKKIAPLRALLAAEKEKGPGLTEIIGGIGWLVGLAGFAAYAGSRRGRPSA